tara:strand:+ start:3988 stop:5256 length:1269 start_codon:yes stop_codon:yes gene_type:complete
LSIFLNKKILIYGSGRSGLSTLEFLRNKSDVFLYDDFKKNLKNSISNKLILKKQFDFIIISPGIDINKCKLSQFLKKNLKKIYTDLDVFYSFYKNDCISITGTNGKSTTCQLLYEILSKHKYDVKLVGNIGKPILSAKNIKSKTIFVIEASSYQLEYSQIFKSKYAAILNISPDHLDRHKTVSNYVKTKFKIFKNNSKNSLGFINKKDFLTIKELKRQKLRRKILKVNTRSVNDIQEKIDNEYFLNDANKENLAFIMAISNKLKLKKKIVLEILKKFKGLKYRQQIIYKNSLLTIINDSKSTSFSSSIPILKKGLNIYWLLGGVPKKGDKFNLPKQFHSNIKAFIYGKNKKFFSSQLKGKIHYSNFSNLSSALKKIFIIISKKNFLKKTIIFSPSAASFDSFKNFEDRGLYFNELIKRHLNG